MHNTARSASLQHAILQPVWILPLTSTGWDREQQPWEEDGNLPTVAPNLMSMKIGSFSVKPLFMLSSASQIFIWRWQPVRGQSIKIQDSVTSFLPHSETSTRGSYSKLPSRLRVILEIQFLPLLHAVFTPSLFLFLAPCQKRGSVQSIPFFYSAVLVEAAFIHWMMELKKGEKIEAKRWIKLRGFIFLPLFSPLLALKHTRSGSWAETSEWQRWMCSAFSSSFASSPSHPSPRWFPLNLSPCFALSEAHTEAGCLVMMAETRAETSVNVLMLWD